MGRYDLDFKQKKSSTPFIVIILIIICAVAFFAIYSMQPSEHPQEIVKELPVPTVTTPTHDKEESTSSAESETLHNSEENPQFADKKQEVLPGLDQSDSFFISKIKALSNSFTFLLSSDDLIRRWMRIINDFSQSQRVYKNLRFFSLAQPFQADQDDTGWYLSHASYQRYDALAKGINAIDDNQIIETYLLLKPLLQQAFAEFNYPGQYRLEDIIQKAMADILAAPVIDDPITLIKPGVLYKFSDPQLENLNPVQKQMLRMGPENTRMLQAKVRSILQQLIQTEETR